MPDDLRQRYVEALARQLPPPGIAAFRLADAVMAVRDDELERLREERDQAIAHDRQPYPTQWAYDQACAALEKHRERAEKVESALTSARNLCARSPLCIPEGIDHA